MLENLCDREHSLFPRLHLHIIVQQHMSKNRLELRDSKEPSGATTTGLISQQE